MRRASDKVLDRGDASAARRRWLPLVVTLAVAAALQAKMFLLVWRYSVNVLYQDQWDYYTPLFEGRPVSDFFLWQIGPVRQGVGFLIYKYVSELSGWDARAEGMAACGVVFAALLCAVWLKGRLFGSFAYWDVLIPLLFLTPVLAGVYTLVPNPSHGPFPLLLVVLYCLAWGLRGRLKYLTVVLVNFLLIFTTFGIIMGLITPALLSLEYLRAVRGKESCRPVYPLLALLISLASLASFFVGYIFAPASDCFQLFHPRPLEYAWFVSVMFACFWRLAGSGTLAYLAGLSLTLLMVALFARHAYLLLRDRTADRGISLVVAALSGFSLMFAASAAFGRVCMGLNEARGSRYIPYLIPAFLALYFQLLTLKDWRPFGRVALVAFLAVSALMTLAPMSSGNVMLEEVRRGKAEWKRCYVEIENVEECDKRANFKVYTPITPLPMEQRLNHLKQNKLNLYADD